ncbi:MAG: DNA recombination protein RmuC [Rikenellaceae bacterium]
MEILLILGLNAVAIVAVWVIGRRRGDDSDKLKSELEDLKAQYKQSENEVIKLSEQITWRDDKITEQQTALKSCNDAEAERQSQLLDLNRTCATLREQITSRNTKITELQDVIDDLKGSEEKLEQRLKSQFELISNKIIEESRDKVNRFNADNISTLMKPFEKEIKEFKEQITSANREQSKERMELETKIKQMAEISKGMSEEAKNLSNALRGNNKTAGNWGETILENILQNSGLTPGREGYELQEMLRDEQGNAYRNDMGHKMIPDAIVHFPDNRNVIIDSKVSISAYTDYCNAEDEEQKRIYLKQHISSIKAHIDGLNIKSYERYVDGSLDFVMMFIPNDYAAMVALSEDLNLWQNAYNKKILIISPTNLITSLKIVSDLWSREKQHQNIENILDRGRLLYDKCCIFVESFKKVGEALQSATKIYDGASSQLSGRGGIIRQAELLEKSGIKSKKSLALKSNEEEEEVDS